MEPHSCATYQPPCPQTIQAKGKKYSHFLATLAALIYLPLLVGESVSGAANLEFDTSNPDCLQDPDPDPDQDHHRDHHQDHRQVHEQDHVLSVQFRTLATFSIQIDVLMNRSDGVFLVTYDNLGQMQISFSSSETGEML